MLKQVIAVRKDLGMRRGKAMAQVAHASMMFLSNSLKHNMAISHTSSKKMFIPAVLTKEQQEWLKGLFTKIVVGVDSEEELLALYYEAVKQNLTAHIVQDAGLTEFDGVPTYTAVALGPHDSEVLDPLTGKLKLL